jgi:hypothetical protein
MAGNARKVQENGEVTDVRVEKIGAYLAYSLHCFPFQPLVTKMAGHRKDDKKTLSLDIVNA